MKSRECEYYAGVLMTASQEMLKKHGSVPPTGFLVKDGHVQPIPLQFGDDKDKDASVAAMGSFYKLKDADHAFIVSDALMRTLAPEQVDEKGRPKDGLNPSEVPLDDRQEAIVLTGFSPKRKYLGVVTKYKRGGRNFDQFTFEEAVTSEVEEKSAMVQLFNLGAERAEGLFGQFLKEQKEKGEPPPRTILRYLFGEE